MSLQITCPKCGAMQLTPESEVGKTLRCGQCNEPFPIVVETNFDAMSDSKTPLVESLADWVNAGEALGEDDPPDEFGRYRLLRKLGEGGMGAVYLAEETEMGNRKVALKVPRPSIGRRPDIVARFKREARIGQEFRHERFCAAYDWGRFEKWLYLSMEYIEGGTLKALLEHRGRLPESEAIEISRTLALALAAAHRRKIIHRDLKPANVMIDKHGEFKITDFGLAKWAELDDPKITMSQESLGTPAFQPPEQAKTEQSLIGPRSDVYSLGVILFQLATGRLPYEGSIAGIHAQLLSDAPPTRPSERYSEVSPAFETVCLKAIAKNPKDRYESMEAFAEALRNAEHQPLDVIENSLKMKLVLIPAGKFLRGSPETDKDALADEKPQREITLTKSFWLGMHEVTQAEYRAAMQGVPGVNASPSRYKGDDRPVEQVSWFDAVRFCNEVSRREGLPTYYRIEGEGDEPAVSVPDRAGLGYRLPTEAEWEYACRAGSRTRYHFGDDEKDLAKYAWFGDPAQGTHPAGRKEANDFKLRDMHGNVWEWCEDWYDAGFYKTSQNQDSLNINNSEYRVIRGGSFLSDAGGLRSAYRDRFAPAYRYVNCGFRLSRTFR